MKRNISRIKALVELYQYDLLNKEITIDTFDDLLEEVEENISYDKKFTDDIVNGVIQNLSAIDRKIAIYLDNYPLDRLSYIDRTLIRIGVYEMLYTDTPHQIIINEIVELSKEYSQVEGFLSSKFNNAVLDKISKSIKK